jgi:polysaccharide pyruvyl transferase WcaK-like protein
MERRRVMPVADHAAGASVEPTSGPPKGTGRARIALFGIFGIQNLGNECTLQATLHNVRERLPGAELYTICYEPRDVLRRHALPSVSVSARSSTDAISAPSAAGRNPLRRWLRILFRRIPGELREWLRAFRTLQGTDLLLMTGTGMLTDYNCSASGYPYDVLKWTVAGRLAGCKVRFVSIGVGPLHERLSRRFVRWALGLADYRSYRDHVSRSRLEALGIDTSRDRIFPDLAFSLPPAALPDGPAPNGRRCVVGLGVMNHVDAHEPGHDRPERYRRYLSRMGDFAAWLVERGYGVRILQGDAKHDGTARRDLRATLEQRGLKYGIADIVDEDSTSVSELLVQLAQTDVVVSPRFHNLILGLLLNKPVMSISYDPKNDALLEQFGLGRYCQPIDALDVDRLIEQFIDLDRHRAERLSVLREKADEHRRRLDEQYRLVLANR